jgi:uncharacterized integral membrane protein (TIGR00698 family)
MNRPIKVRASSNPYANPELFRFVGSMEGLPEVSEIADTVEERSARTGWREKGHALFGSAGLLMPGIGIAIGLATIGSAGSAAIGSYVFEGAASPVSPILIAILGGLLVRNTIGVPAIYELGLELCLKRILRVGVALLGIRLSLLAAGATGLVAVPIALATIGTALLLVTWLSRVVGLPKRLGMLIAVGTAICGNTAIVATGPVIGADEDEVSYAVACITLFGLFALIVHPFIAFELFAGNGHLAGLFLGSAIHDTAQVAGAGLLYAQQFGDTSALESATVTKLVRNLFMIGVIPLMAAVYHEPSEGKDEVAKPSLRQLVPFFVFGFIAMAFVRTLGDVGERPFGFLDPDVWALVIKSTSTVSTFCLTIAMATVGLGTNLRRLQMLGLKPLAVGLGAALIVGTVGAGMIKLIAPMIG